MQDILDKVRKLHALAENPTTGSAEAENARIRLHEIMEKYHIDDKMLWQPATAQQIDIERLGKMLIEVLEALLLRVLERR